jgi:hypothetical protein
VEEETGRVVEGIGEFAVAVVTVVAVLASIFTSVAGATASVLIAPTSAVVPTAEAAVASAAVLTVGSEYSMMAVVVVLSKGTPGAAEYACAAM